MSEIPEVFAIFEQKLAHVLSFTLREKGQKKAIEELLVYFSGIVERASKAESRIAELEAERRWIPVSERLPEKGNLVIGITDYCGYVFFEIVDDDGQGIVLHPYRRCQGKVTHWMPLPEPPVMYGKVCEE